MSNNGERFAKLFRGYTGRYGRYDITGEAAHEEKVAGRARTVDEMITQTEYDAHVEGTVGIGVIPLNEDSCINFAAIDIDIYKAEEQARSKLTHTDIALALFDTPLIVSRSKSGGIHVWLFAKEPVSARLATDYLNIQAAKLGVAGTEIFPKQTERVSDEDVGNWINLPYFGGKRTAVLPHKNGSTYEFFDADLAQFLDIAEAASTQVTDDWLIEQNKLEPSQRDGGDNVPLWFDGPPCLQALLNGHPEKRDAINKKFERGDITEDQRDKQLAYTQPQLGDGSRNNCFLNVGHYLRRRLFPYDTDVALDKEDQQALAKAIEQAHTDWRVATGNTGIASELATIQKQAAKGKWGYACTKEPLKGHCNRRLCMKRKFGVGTATNDAAFAITGFTIVNTADKQYYMNVGDKRVHVPDVQTLMSQVKFGEIVLNETNRMWIPMQDTKYKEMMDGHLQNADVIEGPPDSDRRATLLNALDDFVRGKSLPKGKNDAAIYTGRVLLSENEVEAWFKFDQFTSFLRSRCLQFTNGLVANMLINDFGVTARGNTHVGGRQLRPYVVNMVRLEKEMAGDHGED